MARRTWRAGTVHPRRLRLIGFEAVVLLWIGFQPLEAVVAVVGATVATLAVFVGRRFSRRHN